MLNKKIFLVTGGAGFIGSHTVEHIISRGYEVRVIDNLMGGTLNNLSSLKNNKNLEIMIKDIKKLDLCSKFFKDIYGIIHFAGSGSIVPSIENPNFYIENNLYSTTHLLDACVKNNIKNFVYAASSSCYGLAKTPTSESHKIQCEHPYALSKYFGEQAALHWAKVYRLNVNSLRIFNAYGPRLTTKGAYGTVFAVFMKQILERKPLTVVGSGNQKRDYVYVTDVANAFFKAVLLKTNARIFNIGAGKPQSLKYMIKLLVGNNYKKITIPNRPSEPKITHADISLAKKELDWIPLISFENGIQQMLNDINYWKNSKLWNKENISKATLTWFKYLRKVN
jgi:UDP-glucose 4-epimerase